MRVIIPIFISSGILPLECISFCSSFLG